MIDGVMKQLDYSDSPEIKSYDSPICREYLRKSSDYSCAYCTISESEAPGATFHIDHFRPQAKFPHLKNEYYNLRYTCPRCNLTKGSYWIRREDGCIRDCEKCNTKYCHENVYRLIDCFLENPKEHIRLNDNDMLEAINGSKPAIHTIKYLRLNRAQLIKLRRTRRYIDLWKQELDSKKKATIDRISYIQNEKKRFEALIKAMADNCNEPDKQMCDIVALLFSMLSEEASYSLGLIDQEIEKVTELLEMRAGSDDSI